MSKYALHIDLNVLNHLGLNLYSNIPAVLSEMIANAWDAEAERVYVSIEKGKNKRIIIKDNGCGMDDHDLREKFLKVGYQRRKKGANADKTPNMNRPVMGRKGIGKLSTLSIARKVQIITKKKNSEILAIELNVEKIQEAIKKNEVYYPPIIANPPEVNLGNSGTVLILSGLKKRMLESFDQHLRQRVARRFSIFSEDFQVFINNQEVTLSDRNYFKKLEHSLVYGNYDKNNSELNKVPKTIRSGKTEGGYLVNGWIGLVEKPQDLQDGDDNINKISVVVRGKVAQEDILSSFRKSGLYTKYIVGELEADFLDLTKKDDIATSSRQNFIESDERFSDFKKFVEKELGFIQPKWRDIRSKKGVEKAQEIPAIKRWLAGLKGDTKSDAKKFFGRINIIAVDDEHRKTLLKYGVLAFAHLQHKQLLSKLDLLDIENLEATVELFSRLDDIEAGWYHEITKGRLETINKLSENIYDNVQEKVIQRYIYDHLWLLDPSWDRATETPRLEETVIPSFDKVSEKLTKEERSGRIDIRYKKISGKHVIIELKRSSVSPDVLDLIKQVRKYKDALKKQLEKDGKSGPVEVVCLVGKLPSNWGNPDSRRESENILDASNTRLVTYKQLIIDAEVSYRQYLEKGKARGELQQLLDDIEEFDYFDK